MVSSAASAYVSLPAWVAAISQVPALRSVTVPAAPETVHTSGVFVVKRTERPLSEEASRTIDVTARV